MAIGLNTSGGLGGFISNPLTSDTGQGGKGRKDFDSFVMKTISIGGAVATGPDREIKLVGNMMPMIPFTYGGEQNVVKEYYVGNPEAAVQVLGSRERDLTIKGRFKSKRLGGGESNTSQNDLYEAPYQISDAIDELRRSGSILELRMGDWLRYGVIQSNQWDMKTKGDISYQITFSIISLDLPKRCHVVDAKKVLPMEERKNLEDLSNAFGESFAGRIPASVPISVTDLLNNVTGVVAEAVGGVLGVFDSIIETGEDITKSITRAVGLTKYAKSEVSRMRIRLGRISQSLDMAGIPLADKYKTSNVVYGSIRVTNDVSQSLAKILASLEKLRASKPKTRYRTIEGDTLQKISAKFYQTPDNWDKIKEHNSLASSEVTRGTVLEIPEL